MKKSGFSLVELSIVLVILGLLTGGILTGQNLIRASEMRSVTTEFQNYQTAIYTFRDKYFALPGDMRNATDFWGTDPDGCPTHTTRTKKTETCNGNGNGRIGDTGEYPELFRAWQHLAAAGLVEGSYTGITGTASTYQALIDDNVPRAKLSNAGFTFNFYHGSIASGDPLRFEGDYGSVMLFGAQGGSSSLYGSVLKPEEAWNIDTKVDDGKPGYGRLVSYKNNSDPDCATTDDRATAEYDLPNDTIGCDFVFKLGL